MSFVITHIKKTNIELTDELEALIEEKLAHLEKFTHHSRTVTCDVELERMAGKNHGDIFRAEANVTVDGKLFRAEATTDTIQKSIDEIRDELADELRKAHTKSHTLLKRGGAKLKRMMQWGE